MISFCKIFYGSFIKLLVPVYFLYRYFIVFDPGSSESVLIVVILFQTPRIVSLDVSHPPMLVPHLYSVYPLKVFS